MKNGDYFNFTLPSILRVSNQQFPIVDQSTGTVLANVTVNSDDNTGRVVFNSVGSDAAGTFNIQMNVDTTKVPANKETPINISVNGENKIAGSFTYTPGTVSPDEMFSKYSYNDTLGPDKSNPNDTNPSYYTPDDITHGNLTYALRVNPGAKHGINGTTINDQLTTPGYRYDPDSFLVYRTTWTYTNGNWSNGALEYDSSIKPVIAADGRSFTLDFGDAVDDQGFVVFYRLLAYDANGKKWVPVNQLPVAEQPANGTIIGNNAVLKSTNNEPVYYNQTMQIYSSNGSGSISNFNIQGVKTWNDGNNAAGQRPTSITIDLYADDNPNPVRTVTTDASQNWEYVFTNLRRYREGETGAQIRYRVVEEPVAHYVTTYNGYNTVNTYVAPVNVTKVWHDDNNRNGARPTSITVDLYRNNVKTDQQLVLNNSNNWQGSLAGLPVYDVNGNKISYTWQEANVPTDYTASYDDQTNTITNTYTPKTTSVAVNKTWADGNNQDGLRPGSVTVELLANGQATGQTVTLDTTNNWTASFDNLAVNKDGQAIIYTVQEKAVSGYTSTVSGDAEHGFTITNTHTPATVDKAVNKAWVDGNNQDGLRPDSVTVELLADGQATGQTVTLNAGNNWRGSLSGLAEYANGKKITYTWQETDVPTGYTATVDGDTITNTHTPATIDKTVNKVWVDGNNQDGLRPGSVTVELLADGQTTGQTVTLNTGNNWRGGLSGLAEYANGKKITYTWREDNVPASYTATVDGDTITNTHTPATVDKSVNKVWVDGNNQDGLRPDAVTVELLADGQATGQTVTLNAGNNWRGGLSGLAEYANGKKIVYTWREDNVPTGYTTTVDGDTVTNTHTPATIDKAVNKVWVDGNNQDGLRPDSITVELLADGQATGQTVTLNAGNNWRGGLSGLAEYANGKKITYTWQETDVPAGYTATVDGDTVTNTHTPATIDKAVNKVWVDGNNQDGLRPDSVTVELLADGQATGQTVTLNAGNNWRGSLSGLAEYANGKKIAYTWQETDVPTGYTATVDGDTVTNTHTPATITKTVMKQWVDGNNQDGLRPKSIMVQLLANGQAVATAQLDATNNWMTSFDDLAVNQDGQPILYTVKEVNIPSGYQSVVTNDGNGFVITNTHIPNVPDIPSTPEQPNTPTIPGTPERPLQPQPEGMDKQLPQTGNRNSLAIVALGLLIGGITVSLATKHF